MIEVSVTKDGNTWPILVLDTVQDAENFIQNKIDNNSFGEGAIFAYEDIAARVANKAAEAKEERMITHGVRVIAKIRRINKSKLGSTEAVDAFMDIPIVIKILKHLTAGNLETAYDVITDADLTGLFSATEKSEVLSFISDLVIAEG